MKTLMRNTILFLLLSFLMGGVGLAQMADKEIRAFRVEPVEIDVDLAYYLNHETRDWLGYRIPQVVDENGIQERIQLRSNGYIYHPDLLAWRLNGGLILRQRRLTSGLESGAKKIDEILSEYDFGVDFLGSHPVTAGFAMTQNVSDVNGDLQQAINVITSTISGRLNWTTGKLTQSLIANRNHYVSESLIGTDEVRRNARYELSHNEDRLRTRVRLNIGETRQVTLNRLFQTRTGRLTSLLRLDNKGDQIVDLNLYYNDQIGQIDNLYREGSLTSRHELGRGLNGSLGYSRRESQTGSFESNTTGLEASLTHQLYQSLRSTARYAGNSTDFGNGDRNDQSSSIRADYNKRTFFGRLDIYYGFAYRDYREDFSEPGRVSRAEEQTYIFGQAFMFSDPRIDPLSLVVLNLTRPQEILRTGIDYTVALVGDAMIVDVEPAGLIREGDVLRFHYDLVVDESFNYLEHAPAFGTTLTFGTSFNISYAHSNSAKNVLRGNPGSIVSDVETNAARFRWRAGSLVLSGDYTHRRTISNPYKRRGVQMQYSRPFWRRLNLALNTSYVQADYFDNEGISDVYGASGTLWYRVGPATLVESRLNTTERRGRLDDGHDLIFGIALRHQTPGLEYSLQWRRLDRSVLLVGTEGRDLVSTIVTKYF